jgi:hypothetical protein
VPKLLNRVVGVTVMIPIIYRFWIRVMIERGVKGIGKVGDFGIV